MSELRQNMVTREWVIIATERARRPNRYAESREQITTGQRPPHDPACPFCPGNEEAELEVERLPADGPWQARAVENRYPALHPNQALARSFDGVQRRISGMGRHEIVTEHPRHNTTLALMTPAEVGVALELLFNRGWNIQKDYRIEQVIYFKNHRQRAGASLPHPHSQIIALPVVPHFIRQRAEQARRYFDDTGDCAYCVMLEDELRRQVRVVETSDHFAAFILYAATAPFHLWIVPRRHSVSYLYTDPAERADLAVVLGRVLRRMYIGLHDPAFNMIIRSAPAKELNSDYLHWYVTLVPRLSQTAGFEMGSGMYINPSLPEECAAFLRELPL